MKLHFQLTRYLLFALSILFISACSSKKEEAPTEISEQKSSSGVSLDSPEGVLFQKGQDLYQNKLYSLAIEHFEALRTGYPIGPYGEYADIKVADCHFEQGNYSLAAQAYEDFIKNRPASKAVPYVLFRAGRSHQLANNGVGRDPAPLENAAKHYQRLISEYPNSFYTLAAAEYQKEVVETLAEHEKTIISFYEKKDKINAVEARNLAYNVELDPKLKTVREVAETEVAKEREKQNLELSANQEGKFPPPEPVKVAQALNPMEESQNLQFLAKTKEAVGMLKIQEVRCESSSNGKDRVFVFLSKAIDEPSFEKKHSELKSTQGMLSLKLPSANASAFTKDCFGSDDLSVKTDGTIELKTSKSARLMLLGHPHRLLMVLD